MKTKEINGKVYGVPTVPATKGLQLQLKLGKLLGGGLSELKKMDGSNSDTVIKAIGETLATLDDKEVATFIKDTVSLAKKMIQVDGVDEPTPLAISFDKDFEDDYVAMWEVFLFVLESVLGKFLQDVKLRFVSHMQK